MAPYARAEVVAISLLGAASMLLVAWLAGWFALLPALLAAGLLSFYRDPTRRPPARADVLLAPADGRIMYAGAAEPAADGTASLRIVIFLSVFNVHVNRAPCAARVLSLEHRPGLFLNALKVEATQRNESNRVVFEPALPLPGPVVVRQIAGLLAKRIVCRLVPGQTVAAGERFGMIKLGSQTEISAPGGPGWRIRVSVGDSVRAGETILAEWSPAPAGGPR